MTRSSSFLLELSSVGVDKAAGVGSVASSRGLSSEDVLAFGDMPNDVALLSWAGWGVAVANAHPEALAAADQIGASNDEDGVAQVLEGLTALGS